MDVNSKNYFKDLIPAEFFQVCGLLAKFNSFFVGLLPDRVFPSFAVSIATELILLMDDVTRTVVGSSRGSCNFLPVNTSVRT